VRLAALRTAWQVAAVATAVVLGVIGLVALFILDKSRPTELIERPRPGETKIYVDANDVLVVLVVLGVLAVAVVGVASWVISARAVAPLGSALRMQRATRGSRCCRASSRGTSRTTTRWQPHGATPGS
jgi:two-component system OmpR family sensor kinase